MTFAAETRTEWVRPASVQEACSLLAEAGPAGRPVAGCTALPPAALVADRQIRLAIDLMALPELATMEKGEGLLCVGATVTARALAHDPLVGEAAPMLSHVAQGIGDEVLQGMATIGGNVATRFPVAFELPLALASLGASIDVRAAQGARTLDAVHLCDPDWRLAHDEVIVGFRVPATGRWTYRKLTTNLPSYGIASLAIHVPAQGPPAAFAALGTPCPQRLAAAEEVLAAGDRAAVAEAAREACRGLRAHDDALASAAYRLRALESVLEEELARLLEGER